MIHRCESYPGVIAVKKFIEEELMKANGDGQVIEHDDVEITFQQAVDHQLQGWTDLFTLPLEFIKPLCEQLD